ncbi:MAG: hypothetical protein IJZ56_06335 [Oscillospiraceae bacterium]|nr:hypothetical protein [Oscillospiraceae bacterium]
MSASNKKKLRKEQAAEKLTERQQQEQAEAKKLKIYTVSFLIAMILIACTVVVILGVRFVRNSGVIEKNTIAATVGDRQLNTVELNYYYIDAVNNFYNQWQEYYDTNADTYLKSFYGLDATLPLNQQYTDDTKTESWADYFITQAINQAQHDYAMYDLATAEKFTLDDEHKASMDSTIKMFETYASIYTAGDVDKYLSAVYGNGASLKTYKAYYERSMIAAEYYAAHEDTFVYTDEQREEYQKDKAGTYNSFSYTSCYLTYTDFRGEGTKGEDGKTTYTDEQNDEARKKMAEAAKELATATSIEELKEKAKNAPVSEGKSLTVKEEKNVLHDNVSTSALRDWLTEEGRQAGDIAAVPNESTVTDDDGKESTVVNGYYVVIYNSCTDNTTAMADIGYIFVPYQGGEEDEETGDVKYSEEDKTKTRTAVEGYLKQWQDGEKTAASLEELANTLIKDKKAEAGGLVENINPASDFADAITTWALDEARVAGDTTIVEADEGFYLLYYSAKSKLNYRHYMIDTDMRAEDYTEWYENAIAAVTVSKGNLSRMDLGLILSTSTAS